MFLHKNKILNILLLATGSCPLLSPVFKCLELFLTWGQWKEGSLRPWQEHEGGKQRVHPGISWIPPNLPGTGELNRYEFLRYVWKSLWNVWPFRWRNQGSTQLVRRIIWRWYASLQGLTWGRKKLLYQFSLKCITICRKRSVYNPMNLENEFGSCVPRPMPAVQ